jgi:putative acetyltransferase
LFQRLAAPMLSSMLMLTQARSADEIDRVRSLLRQYQQRLGVDLSFQGFEAELDALPGSYAPPSGRLLLASHEQTPVGCVALQRVTSSRAEMKRLYVPPSARGLGVGRKLVAQILAEAQAIGYAEVVLDTLPTMLEAQRLYEQFGFRNIEPYRPNPIAGTRYLGKTFNAR